MSSIVTSILSSTVGLLWNKARDTTAAKLKDGDPADARIRKLIVRELDDMKTKLDGLSRKDLLSSYTFLQEGVDFLNSCLEKTSAVDETHECDHETSTMMSTVESSRLNEALELSRAVGKLKIGSEIELESAKKRFEEARKTATHAFCNEALSVQDRIFAAKVRIISEILECVDRPETAITGCLSFLKQLHAMPAIQEMFTVYLNKGVKSLLSKSERVENIKSIMLINDVLFQYVSKFRGYSVVFEWPTVALDDGSFHAILSWPEISTRKSMGDELSIQHPSEIFFVAEIDPEYTAINSHGDVAALVDLDNIVVIPKTGEMRLVNLPERSEADFSGWFIAGLAFDKDDNLCLVRWIKTRTENGDWSASYKLCVLDGNYNIKSERTLDFLKSTDFVIKLVKVAINWENNLVMIAYLDPYVYICDRDGTLKHKFERVNTTWPANLCISKQKDVIASAQDDKTLRIYSEEGDLKSTITVPEGHEIHGISFHHVICKIIVLTERKDSYFLHCYTEAGVLETTTFFCNISKYKTIQTTSHPGGPAVVVTNKSITFI
jgi:hypothetical protein